MDRLNKCITCQEEFDDNPDTIAKQHRSTSHLPVKSSKCKHNMCISCVNRIMVGRLEMNKSNIKSIKWLECPYCQIKTCFNTEDPIIDENYCELLRIARSLTSEKKKSSRDVESIVDGDKKPSANEGESTQANEKKPSASDNNNSQKEDTNGMSNNNPKSTLVYVREGVTDHLAYLLPSPPTSAAATMGKDDTDLVWVKWTSNGVTEQVPKCNISYDELPSRRSRQNSSNTSIVRNEDNVEEDDKPRKASQHKKKQKFAVGTKVSKSFYDPELKANRQYSGKVISYDIQSYEYLIRYEDEDEEDISEKELSTILDSGDSGKKSTSDSDQCMKVNRQQTMKRNRTSLPRSSPITRRQLHCLTGGIHGGYKNPLKVGTPVLDCGGRAFATKGGRVHHICIKATNDGKAHNHPLPKSIHEKFLLYRTTKRGGLGSDICSLIEQPNHPPIPIFWEPAEQANGGAKKVLYVGHWKVTSIIDYSKKPITYMNHPRCALIKFNFDHFSTRWDHIIRRCHDKTTDEIKAMNWDIDETDETAQAEDNTVTRCNKRKRGTQNCYDKSSRP